jgi:hypothetical protein
MPQISNGDGSSLRSLINHVKSHINALLALALNVPMQDLILNKQCPLCKGSHRLFKCEKFLKLQNKQHFRRAKQLEVLF